MDRRRVPLVTHTHALLAGQSHSIVDNLVALLGYIRAWNCSDQNWWPSTGALGWLNSIGR